MEAFNPRERTDVMTRWERLRAWWQRHLRRHQLFYAKRPSDAPVTELIERSFRNELGHWIRMAVRRGGPMRITIEGPGSICEYDVTPYEAQMLRLVLRLALPT